MIDWYADKLGSYDVFISHRGPDTKTGFVSFLEKDLRAAGLQAFLDCKSINVVEDSWESIEHAIKKTPIAVVIFSERFAESAWCLRELHVMLHSPGVKVVPVFYNVRPSEVRYVESGKLKDGFEKLTSRHDKTVIEEWRADLERASQIMGVELTDGDKR
jgi:leucine-rich repeat protein SHOC2